MFPDSFGGQGRIVGIDFGTTKSVVAVMATGGPTMLENADGARLTPSVLAISPGSDEPIVGQAALRRASSNPGGTVAGIGRFMGRRFAEPAVQAALKYAPFEVRAAPDGEARIVVSGREYAPPEIAGLILSALRRDAEARLGQPIRRAVICVPATADYTQRRAIREAARSAGIEVARVIAAPVAAALAYGLRRQDRSRTIAVYDLGGGTFDVAIVLIDSGVFEVKATNGVTHLGGDDFDQRVIDWLADEFRREHGIDPRSDRTALQRLKEAAERAKIELSTIQQTEINLPFIAADGSGPKHLTMTLSRVKLEQLVADLIERTVGPCRQALQDAGLTASQIDEVLLVGGQTRMPAVQQVVEALFGQEPRQSIEREEAAAAGAAIQAAILGGELRDVLLMEVTPLTLGLETLSGASTPPSLGTRAASGVMRPVIPRNTTIPTMRSEIVTTAADGQTSIEVHVLQGEHLMAAENRSLRRLTFDGLAPAPRGTPQIEVIFDIDANGDLVVSAKDKASGRALRAATQASAGPASEEIERLGQRLDARFARAQEEYGRLRAQLQAGRLTTDQFEAALDAQMIEHEGRYWAIGAESGRWYVYDGQDWREAAPPVATSSG